MDSHHIEVYSDLTERALKEDGLDEFINLLLQRMVILENMMENNVNIDSEEASNYLLKELNILKKLEAERKKLLVEMEELSKNKKAIKKYSPKFPFPPMPVFFDKKG